MITFVPYIVSESELTTDATIAYDSAYFGTDWKGEWDDTYPGGAGTGYDAEHIVYNATTLHIYESLASSNTDDPTDDTVDPATWLDRGYVNPWRCFDNYVGDAYLAVTTAISPLNMVITTDNVAHVALLNVTADTVTVSRLDSSDVVQWSVEFNMLDDALGISDWYDYRYMPYPSVMLRDLVVELDEPISSTFGDKLKITLESGEGTVSIGSCFPGYAEDQGNTQWKSEIKSYNTGETTTDTFGRTAFNKGENYRSIRATVNTPVDSAPYVLRALEALQNVPAVYDFNNDGTDYDQLRAFGAIVSIGQIIEGRRKISVDVEIISIVKKEEVTT